MVETTGGFGNLKTEQLPKGWANVAINTKDRSRVYSDDVTVYYGPVLMETPQFVQIEVYGSPITVPKKGNWIEWGAS